MALAPPGYSRRRVNNLDDHNPPAENPRHNRKGKTMTTLYTVARQDGEQREYNLTLAEAARAILQHDGADYDIRPRADGEGFDLWTRQQVAGIPWSRTSVLSLEESEDAAEADIFKQVVDKSGCDGWRGLVAEKQSSYRATLERMRADYDPVDDADVIAGLEAELAQMDS